MWTNGREGESCGEQGLFPRCVSAGILRRMNSIPFSMDLGVSSVRGMLRLEDTGLIVEWRSFDLFGASAGTLVQVTVPYRDLAGVELKRRLFGARLVITAHRASAFEKIPLPSGDIATIKVNIPRSRRRDAPGFAAEAELRIVDVEDEPRIPEDTGE